MRNYLSLTVFLLFTILVSASNKGSFEGTYTVSFKSDRGELTEMNVIVKDSLVLLKNIKGGNTKYSSYLLNLNSDRLVTISKPEKKVAIIYPFQKLLNFYERNNLKDGYKTTSDIVFKATEKTKEENGVKMTKYTGENLIEKSTFWLAETGFNFNQLIPFLRLIGCWNDAQIKNGTIMNAEVTGKVTKNTSTATVTFKKGIPAKSLFEIPKNYLQKDFVKLMEDEKNNKDLKMVIQTFAGF